MSRAARVSVPLSCASWDRGITRAGLAGRVVMTLKTAMTFSIQWRASQSRPEAAWQRLRGQSVRLASVARRSRDRERLNFAAAVSIAPSATLRSRQHVYHTRGWRPRAHAGATRVRDHKYSGSKQGRGRVHQA